jgi:hypothetical protein
MWRKLALGVIVAAAATFADGTSSGTIGVGLSAAQAKDYYTRKRVNGRWVVGKFASNIAPKGSANIDHPIPPIRPEAINGALVVAAVPATGPTIAPDGAAPATYFEQLRGALEVRADDLRWSLLTGPKKPSRENSSRPPTPDKIVLDLVDGIKTIFYSDGSVREEPIEPTQTGSADISP